MTTTALPAAPAPAGRRPAAAERLLVPAAFISNLGNGIQLTAASFLLFTAQGSALAVGWLFIAVAVPQVLLSLYFGRLADRVDRRTLCIVADLASAVLAVALPVWLWFGGSAAVGAYVASFGLAVVTALFMPASNALVKERIPAERLGPFNAHFEIAVQAGTLLSAAAGGFAIQLFGVGPLFVFNGLTFLSSAAFLIVLARHPVPVAGEQARADAGPGAAVPARPPLILLGLLYAIGNVVIMVGNTILLVLVIQAFRSGVGVLGLTDALFGIGVIGAAVAYRRASARTSQLRIALVGYLGFAAVLAVETVGVGVLMLVIPLAGLTFGLARVSARTMLMTAAPAARVGWVFGATNAFGLGAGAVATVLISVLVDATSARVGFYVLAAVVAVGAGVLIALLARVPATDAPKEALR